MENAQDYRSQKDRIQNPGLKLYPSAFPSWMGHDRTFTPLAPPQFPVINRTKKITIWRGGKRMGGVGSHLPLVSGAEDNPIHMPHSLIAYI